MEESFASKPALGPSRFPHRTWRKMLIPFLQICNTSQLQQILQNTAYYLLPKLPKVELNSYSVGILLFCIFFSIFL